MLCTVVSWRRRGDGPHRHFASDPFCKCSNKLGENSALDRDQRTASLLGLLLEIGFWNARHYCGKSKRAMTHPRGGEALAVERFTPAAGEGAMAVRGGAGASKAACGSVRFSERARRRMVVSKRPSSGSSSGMEGVGCSEASARGHICTAGGQARTQTGEIALCRGAAAHERLRTV